MFSCRIISTDHYQAQPIRELDVTHSDFRNADVQHVPVLRLYGVTPRGQKTCMHIHGIFPYLYVPYDGGNDSERYMRQFACSIDKALNVAMGKPSAGTHHVFKVSLVSGLPFYGFYDEEIPFMKIYFYNPSMVKKVADFLSGGAVMNKVYQPYEAHIPYHLQIFIDYNLYGMNMIKVGAVKFRRPHEDSFEAGLHCCADESGAQGLDFSDTSLPSSGSSFVKWNVENISPDLWLDKDIARQSTCELEVDVVAADILNRLEVGDNVGSNPGLAALWEDERQRRRERGSSQDIAPPDSPGRGNIPWTDAEAELQERLVEIVEQLRPFMQKEEAEGSQGESQAFVATPCSSIDLHMSQKEDDASSTASQDTVQLEESVEEQAVVNARSVLQVVASSQSFRQERMLLQDDASLQPHSQHVNLDTTQDRNVAEILAALAADDDDVTSQGVLSQLSVHAQRLEEQDSILSQLSSHESQKAASQGTGNGAEAGEADDSADETLAMSQEVWQGADEEQEEEGQDGGEEQEEEGQDGGEEQEEGQDGGDASQGKDKIDLAGLDCSWNSSQLLEVAATSAVPGSKTLPATANESDSDSDMSDVLPQYDGPADKKRESIPLKKRLGVRGPVTSSRTNVGSDAVVTGNAAGSKSASQSKMAQVTESEGLKDSEVKSPSTEQAFVSPPRVGSNRASKSICRAFLRDVTTSKSFQLDQYKKFPSTMPGQSRSAQNVVAKTGESNKVGKSPGKVAKSPAKSDAKPKPVKSPKRVNTLQKQTVPAIRGRPKVPVSEKTQARKNSVPKPNGKKTPIKVYPKRGRPAKQHENKVNKKKMNMRFQSAAKKKFSAYMQPDVDVTALEENTNLANSKSKTEKAPSEDIVVSEDVKKKRGRPRKSANPSKIPAVDSQNSASDKPDTSAQLASAQESQLIRSEEDDPESSRDPENAIVTQYEEDDYSGDDIIGEVRSSPRIVCRRGSSDSSGSDDSYSENWVIGPHSRTYAPRSYRPGSTTPPPVRGDVEDVFNVRTTERSPGRSGDRTPQREKSPRSAGGRSPRGGSRSPRGLETSPVVSSPRSEAVDQSPCGSTPDRASQESSKRKGSPTRLSFEKLPVQMHYSDISDEENADPTDALEGNSDVCHAADRLTDTPGSSGQEELAEENVVKQSKDTQSSKVRACQTSDDSSRAADMVGEYKNMTPDETNSAYGGAAVGEAPQELLGNAAEDKTCASTEIALHDQPIDLSTENRVSEEVRGEGDNSHVTKLAKENEVCETHGEIENGGETNQESYTKSGEICGVSSEVIDFTRALGLAHKPLRVSCEPLKQDSTSLVKDGKPERNDHAHPETPRPLNGSKEMEGKSVSDLYTKKPGNTENNREIEEKDRNKTAVKPTGKRYREKDRLRQPNKPPKPETAVENDVIDDLPPLLPIYAVTSASKRRSSDNEDFSDSEKIKGSGTSRELDGLDQSEQPQKNNKLVDSEQLQENKLDDSEQFQEKDKLVDSEQLQEHSKLVDSEQLQENKLDDSEQLQENSKLVDSEQLQDNKLDDSEQLQENSKLVDSEQLQDENKVGDLKEPEGELNAERTVLGHSKIIEEEENNCDDEVTGSSNKLGHSKVAVESDDSGAEAQSPETAEITTETSGMANKEISQAMQTERGENGGDTEPSLSEVSNVLAVQGAEEKEDDDYGPPMLDICEIANMKESPKSPRKSSESVNEFDCPILERFELEQYRDATPSGSVADSEEADAVNMSQLSQALSAAYRKSCSSPSDDNDDEDYYPSPRTPDMFESSLHDHTGCDDFPVVLDNSGELICPSSLPPLMTSNEDVTGSLFAEEVENVKEDSSRQRPKSVDQNFEDAPFKAKRAERVKKKKKFRQMSVAEKRAEILKSGKKFRQSRSSRKTVRRVEKKDNLTRPPNQTVCFPFEFDVNYVNGTSAGLSTNHATHIEGSVRVLKDDCREFDLRQINNEILMIPQLSDQDISEMKEQVKLEVAHRRKETYARQLQLAKPMTIPSEAYKTPGISFYSPEKKSDSDASGDEQVEETLPTPSEGSDFEDQMSAKLSQVYEENISVTGGEAVNDRETPGVLLPQESAESLQREDGSDAERSEADEKVTKKSVEDEESNEKQEAVSAQVARLRDESQGNDSSDNALQIDLEQPKNLGKKRGRKKKRTFPKRKIVSKIDQTTAETTEAEVPVIDSEKKNQEEEDQIGERKEKEARKKPKKWRTEAEKLADDSTIRLRDGQEGRKRERRPIKTKESTKDVNSDLSENEDSFSERHYASDDSDKDVSFTPPVRVVENKTKEPKVPKYRPLKASKGKTTTELKETLNDMENQNKKLAEIKTKKPRELQYRGKQGRTNEAKFKEKKQVFSPLKYSNVPLDNPSVPGTHTSLVATSAVKHENIKLKEAGLYLRTKTSKEVTQYFFSPQTRPRVPPQPLRPHGQYEQSSEDEEAQEEPEEESGAYASSQESSEKTLSYDAPKRSDSQDKSTTCIDLRGFASFTSAPVFKQIPVGAGEEEVVPPKIKCIPMVRKEVVFKQDKTESEYDIYQNEIIQEDNSPKEPMETSSPGKSASYDFNEAEFAVPDVDIPQSPQKLSFHERAIQMKTARKQRKSKEFSELFGNDVTKITVTKASEYKPAPRDGVQIKRIRKHSLGEITEPTVGVRIVTSDGQTEEPSTSRAGRVPSVFESHERKSQHGNTGLSKLKGSRETGNDGEVTPQAPDMKLFEARLPGDNWVKGGDKEALSEEGHSHKAQAPKPTHVPAKVKTFTYKDLLGESGDFSRPDNGKEPLVSSVEKEMSTVQKRNESPVEKSSLETVQDVVSNKADYLGAEITEPKRQKPSTRLRLSKRKKTNSDSKSVGVGVKEKVTENDTNTSGKKESTPGKVKGRPRGRPVSARKQSQVSKQLIDNKDQRKKHFSEERSSCDEKLGGDFDTDRVKKEEAIDAGGGKENQLNNQAQESTDVTELGTVELDTKSLHAEPSESSVRESKTGGNTETESQNDTESQVKPDELTSKEASQTSLTLGEARNDTAKPKVNVDVSARKMKRKGLTPKKILKPTVIDGTKPDGDTEPEVITELPVPENLLSENKGPSDPRMQAIAAEVASNIEGAALEEIRMETPPPTTTESAADAGTPEQAIIEIVRISERQAKEDEKNKVKGKLFSECSSPDDISENKAEIGEGQIPGQRSDIVQNSESEAAPSQNAAKPTCEQLQRVKNELATTLSSSRRGSTEGSLKGDMSEVDFSVLENLMDTDENEGQTGSDIDTHNQLHTPPLLLDKADEEAAEVDDNTVATEAKQTDRDPNAAAVGGSGISLPEQHSDEYHAKGIQKQGESEKIDHTSIKFDGNEEQGQESSKKVYLKKKMKLSKVGPTSSDVGNKSDKLLQAKNNTSCDPVSIQQSANSSTFQTGQAADETDVRHSLATSVTKSVKIKIAPNEGDSIKAHSSSTDKSHDLEKCSIGAPLVGATVSRHDDIIRDRRTERNKERLRRPQKTVEHTREKTSVHAKTEVGVLSVAHTERSSEIPKVEITGSDKTIPEVLDVLTPKEKIPRQKESSTHSTEKQKSDLLPKAVKLKKVNERSEHKKDESKKTRDKNSSEHKPSPPEEGSRDPERKSSHSRKKHKRRSHERADNKEGDKKHSSRGSRDQERRSPSPRHRSRHKHSKHKHKKSHKKGNRHRGSTSDTSETNSRGSDDVKGSRKLSERSKEGNHSSSPSDDKPCAVNKGSAHDGNSRILKRKSDVEEGDIRSGVTPPKKTHVDGSVTDTKKCTEDATADGQIAHRSDIAAHKSTDSLNENDQVVIAQDLGKKQVTEHENAPVDIRNAPLSDYNSGVGSPGKMDSPKKKRYAPKRMDAAFCKPTGAWARKRTENKKFRDTLSLMHQVTLEHLSSKSEGTNSPTSEHSNEQALSFHDLALSKDGTSANPALEQSTDTTLTLSNCQDTNLSVMSTSKVEGVPMLNGLCCLAESTEYSDVMQNMAYLSPMSDRSGPQSPPCPLSPNFHKIVDTSELVGLRDKTVGKVKQESLKSSTVVLENFEPRPLPDISTIGFNSGNNAPLCTNNSLSERDSPESIPHGNCHSDRKSQPGDILQKEPCVSSRRSHTPPPQLETPMSPPASPQAECVSAPVLTHKKSVKSQYKEIPMTPQGLNREYDQSQQVYIPGQGYGTDRPGTPLCDEREMPDVRFERSSPPAAPPCPPPVLSPSPLSLNQSGVIPDMCPRSPSPVRSPNPEDKTSGGANPVEIPLTFEDEMLTAQESGSSFGAGRNRSFSWRGDYGGSAAKRCKYEDELNALYGSGDYEQNGRESYRTQFSGYISTRDGYHGHRDYHEQYGIEQRSHSHEAVGWTTSESASYGYTQSGFESEPYDYGENHRKEKHSHADSSSTSNPSSHQPSRHSSRDSVDDSPRSPVDIPGDRRRPRPIPHGHDRKCIITPMKAPPGVADVIAHSVSAGLTPEQGAYCSNPQDIPPKPRELGGKILKVNSCLISELSEYECGSRGLRHWQQKAAVSQLQQQMSQAASDDVIQQLRHQPSLQVAMFGDQPMVMTPARKPPSGASVQTYIEGRKQYIEEKAAKLDKHSAKYETPKKPVIIIESASEGKSEKTFRPISPARGNEDTTNKRFRTTDSAITSPTRERLDRDFAPSPLRSPPLSGMAGNASEMASPTFGSSFISSTPALPLKKKSSLRSGSKSGRRSSSRRVSFEGDVLHLTPIPKRLSQGKEKGSDIASADDTEDAHKMASSSRVSPVPGTSGLSSRNIPVRRISSGPDALKRVVLSPQLKNQFGSPSSSVSGVGVSQIDGPTPKNPHGFRVNSQCVQDAKALHEYQYLTVLSMELHTTTRGDYRPDPELDPVSAIFYSIYHDIPPESGRRHMSGMICTHEDSARHQKVEPNPNTSKFMTVVDQPQGSRSSPQPSTSKQADATYAPPAPKNDPSASLAKGRHDEAGAVKMLLHSAGLPNVDVTYAKDEKDLFDKFVELIRKWNPDIVVGYEAEMLSWGYLLQRASHLSVKLRQKLSRLPELKKEKKQENEKADRDSTYVSGINIPGRILLNLWTILRHEVTLNVYSFENVAYHVLHRRIPEYSFRLLSHWFGHRTHLYRWRTIEYYMLRAKANIEIMEQLDLIGQTSEFARVFGIEFYHVLSRGSQYRVESMMLRIAKPMNYIPVSPSVQQRARQKAPECIPLTLEPESKFYTDPVVVVDFQSLYPSIMIAHNYCYSTCLGRLECLAKSNEGLFEFGCTSLEIPPKLLASLKKDITICPNGVCFVREHIKKGILPRMVEDILKTRLMVKKSMKDYKEDQTLQRLLHARQLGLKLIANVTFGYTSASFSGRMPAVEIGDSIVRKARETLERAIALVEQTPKWSAKVVYGDTDSMFILLKGRTNDEAFKIGQEIANAVTADNPKPIKLKFEKVYLPCVLQTKKRYVGFMYETPDQKEPVFDAKGIETVRRDTCAAVSKVLEKSIKILFTSRDVSLVKSYVQKQFQKLLEGKVSIQDCVFAKEYRGMPGYKPGACVPALSIARKCLQRDKRSEPRVGERVPYVIVYGTPGLPLIQLVRQPQEVVADPALRINAQYYINQQILPPLNRIFALIGVDVFSWYQELPRVIRTQPQTTLAGEGKKGDIAQYFYSMNCPICNDMTQKGMCASCRGSPQRKAVILASRVRDTERTFFRLYQICVNCMGTQDNETPCISLDCPIMYRIALAKRELAAVPGLVKLQNQHLK